MSDSPLEELEHHEHLEHAEHATHGGDRLLSLVAMTIAILAVLAAVVSSLETLASGEALSIKNEAVLAQAQAYVERQHELYAAGSGKALREEMLAKKALNADGGFDPVDLVMMQALVKRMAKRLADRYSRRRHTANTGHLDVRKTLRKSMAHGGVPFEIEW